MSSKVTPHNETTTKKNNKNVKIQAGNKAAAPTIISKNDLPGILYDHQALLDIINEIPMGPPAKEKAVLYLKNIEHKVDDINRYQSKEHIEHFYHPMKEAVHDIHNTARALYELTKPYHHALSNTLRKLILQAIAPFELELNKRMEMSVAEKEALTLATKRLYAEQSYMVRQKKLQQKLMEHLTKLKQLLTEAGKPSPCCYISYAWPTKENHAQEYWVQPFLSILYDHLTTAGIRVMMDIRDNKPGDSIHRFMEQYHDGNYIILVGTESLLQKHYSIIPNAIQTELSIISDRFEQDQKEFGYSRIYPLLISGSMKASFPEIYDKYHSVRDARETGYLLMLQHLIDWIYEQRIIKAEPAYTSLWHTFYENYPGLPKDADANLVEQELNIGYHRQKLDYSKQNLQFQTIQAQNNHSSTVNVGSGDMVKFLGSDPKHKEYSQQFQRPAITPDFIERQGLWNKIVNHFNQSNQQVLTLTTYGLGGVGKTELAKYYYLHSPKPYTLRAWFNAENKEQLYAQYVDLARANGIEFAKDMSLQEQIRQVKKWLETQKDCLLVYDNVPNAKQIEGLLPEQGKHHILITSRNTVDWPAHQKLDIDVMEEHEAMILIRKITGYQGDKFMLQQLVKILCYLPLALAQAGAYMAEKETSIEDYLNIYQQHQATLMQDETLARNPKHKPVWVTFDINFKALEADCKAALTTLKQASWLDASAIPETLLKAMVENINRQPQDLLWEKVKKYIGHYSFMRVDTEYHQLGIHRLLQDIVRARQKKAEQAQVFRKVCITINQEFNRKTQILEDEARQRNLSPHLQTLVNHYNSLPFIASTSLSDLAKVMYELGTIYQPSDARSAINYYKQALKINEQLYGENHTETANCLANIGMSYRSAGDAREAKKLLERALKIKQGHYGNNHPEVSSIMTNLGVAYKNLGMEKEAKNLVESALKIEEHYYGESHPEVSKTLTILGNIYGHLGDFKQQKELSERALEIQKKYYGENHLEVAVTMADIGCAYINLGDYKLAKVFLERALEIRKQHLGNGHQRVARTLTYLADVYVGLGDFTQAKEILENALEIKENYFGKNHQEVAKTLIRLGNVYGELEDILQASKLLDRALEINQQHYGSDHPEVAKTLNALGDIDRRLGNPKQAKKLLYQALKIHELYYGEDHIETSMVLSNLSNVYKDLQDFKYAKDLLEHVLKIQKQYYGDQHIRVAKTLFSLTQVYIGLQEFESARSIAQRCHTIFLEYYGKDHKYTKQALGLLNQYK